MRKLIMLGLTLCLILCICLLTGCGKDNDNSTGKTGNTNGISGGQDWTETTVPLEDGKYKIERYYNNRITEEYYYDAAGNEEYNVDYRYDDAGQLIRLSWSGKDIGIADIATYEYKYDDSGKLIQKQIQNAMANPVYIYDYYADGTTDLTYYIRDDHPVFTNLTAQMVWYTVTRLDADGNKLYADGHSDNYGHLTHTDYNPDGSATMYTYRWDLLPTEVLEYKTTFDTKGQFLQETFYHAELGHIISVADGVFDDTGVLIGKIARGIEDDGSYGYEQASNINEVMLWYKQYENGVLQYTDENELNDAGLVVKTSKTDGNGVLLEYSTFEYYDNGNCRNQMTYDGNGNFLYGYEYDEQGVSNSIWPES